MGYTNGYLSSVSAGGATRWAATAVNAFGQVTNADYGASLKGEFGYNSYGVSTNRKAKVGTTYKQDYRFVFDSITYNLSSRQDYLRSKSESFTYDTGLDRLLTVTGPQNLTMNYAANGNFSQKSDVGTVYTYGTTGKPYQLTEIETPTGLVSDVEQTVVYTSFEQPSSITESPYQALFTYNADGERAKMEVKQSGATIKTRWYAGSRYLKETAGGVTKEFTWIGGDAYTAPCLAVTQSGATTYYYLLRDHLGTITHVTDASGNVVNEYNFDAWGRRRNFTDWSYTVAAQTDILPDRGFTGHEYLPWFKLYNMNGRLYDPVVGRFLEPDPVLQDASSTQNLNRYSYALNNPLKYSDPSGYKHRLIPYPDEERIIYYEPDYRGRDYNGGFSYRRDNMWSINSMINELSASAYGGSWSSQYGYQTFNSPVVPGLTYTEYTEITVMLLGRGNWNEDRTSLAFSASGNVLIYGVDFKYSVGWSYDGAPIGGGSSFDDAFEPGIGAVGTYYSVKGNALHNDLYWKGKTTGKIYAKNPFVKNKIGWKANSFKATGKVFQGAKSLGSKFGAAGLLLTGYDIVFGNGMTTSNMLDAAFGAAGFIPGVGWAISGSYFLINTGVQLYSGKSIGEHWDE